MIHDISPPLSPDIAVWPGDTPLSREVNSEIASGGVVTLSTLRATVHLGAHADAPSHYGDGAPSIEAQDPELYLGPCQVVHVDVAPGTRVPPEAIPEVTEERLLIATGTFEHSDRFDKTFAGLSPALVDSLARRDVRLVGVDTPSVDLFESKSLEAHGACLRNNVRILEGLVLSDVAPGTYELIALPLRLVGFDGSPVRAILRTL